MKSEFVKSKSCIILGPKVVSVEDKTIEHSTNKVLVRVEAGGICGSDIHYYQHGRAGASILKEPMIIGHEFVGVVHKVPDGNNTLKVGQKVAINPSMPCHTCEECLRGNKNHCKTMKFMGSAQYYPHTQGGFTQFVSVLAEQCIPYREGASPSIMAFSEPLSVAIHAINMAGSLIGKRVLVIGAGTIGGLIIAAAKASGALEVIASDVSVRSCTVAMNMGADNSFDPCNLGDTEQYQNNNGYFDVTFEASGVASAIQSTVLYTKPCGICVQLGMGNLEIDYPVTKFLVKEINWCGSFRFNDEFPIAVNWLETGKVNPTPLISSEYLLADAKMAIITASDKSVSTKVILKIN